jgi:DNA-binding PadR family transcriptional regulator
MKHDQELAKLLLLDARDGTQADLIAKYPNEQVIEQKVRLVEEGLANAAVIRDGLNVRWVKNFRVTAAGHRWLEEMDLSRANVAMPIRLRPNASPRIFISHSRADEDLAGELITLLEKALLLGVNEIRCTSVAGYDLPAGATIDDQLRLEIEESELLIGLVTENSLRSTYVLFELGGRWILRKPLIPVLGKGAKASTLREPLKSLVAASCDNRAQLFALVENIAKRLETKGTIPSHYSQAVERVLSVSKQQNTELVATPPSPLGTTAELSAHEISSLQMLGGGCVSPLIEDIISDNLGISMARARQALESLRRKRLVKCRPTEHDDVEYFPTDSGKAWLQAHTKRS